MKRLLTAVLWTVTSALAVAATPADKDGVPIVDLHGAIVQTSDAKIIAAAKRYGLRVPSQRMIALGDRQMPLDEFLRTYCIGKFQNATCARGVAIVRIDSSKGPQANLPKGL